MATANVSPLSSHPQPISTRVALYGRVSTANGQQDPEMQLRELREYAERRGWQIANAYTDTVTGSKDSRPALNRLMNSVRAIATALGERPGRA